MKLYGIVHMLVCLCCVSIQADDIGLDRDEIRRSILSFRERRSVELYSDEVGETVVRRVRRQVFPSDDEDFGGESSGEEGGSEPLPPDVEDGSEPLPPDVGMVVPPLTPLEPTTVLPGTISYDWVWYRCTINFMQSVEYNEELKDHTTAYFYEVSDKIMASVEFTFSHTLTGYQEVTPLMYTMSEDGDVHVLIDIGTCSSTSAEALRNEMYRIAESGSIAEYSVNTDGFKFREIGVDPGRNECGSSSDSESINEDEFQPTQTTTTTQKPSTTPVIPKSTTRKTIPRFCAEGQATCSNGQCIQSGQLCDGNIDCRDGSDESSCAGATSRCDPTEFLCPNTGVCVMKLWRCDGDDDCGDAYDEQNCPTSSDRSTCQGNEFECSVNKQCVPYSYFCDGEQDCIDGSDEDGCSSPIIITPPKRMNNVTEGETVILECEAAGKPPPLISWRLNWGNVAPPPRVSMATRDGRGTLTINNVQKSDQGAYTCEAINPNGSIFAIPDAVLIVQDGDTSDDEEEPLPPDVEDEDICPDGSMMVPGGYAKFISQSRQNPATPDFDVSLGGGRGDSPDIGTGGSRTGGTGNFPVGGPGVSPGSQPGSFPGSDSGTTVRPGGFERISGSNRIQLPSGYSTPNGVDLCVPCFCFDVTNECMPSDNIYEDVSVDFQSPDDLGRITLKPAESEGAVPSASEPINRNQIVVNPAARELQLIDLSKRFLAAAHYWSLPAEFLGSKINSYGGTLTFTFSYNNSYAFASKPTNHSDIILEGSNGKKLLFHDKDSHPEPTKKHQQAVDLIETSFTSPDGVEASHEDFIKVLSNIDKILIRTVYDKSMLSTGIGDVKLSVALPTSSASPSSVLANDRAMFVEECKCPPAYTGSSCENCADGYRHVGNRCELDYIEPTPPTDPVKQPDEETKCKAGTQGDNCSECKDGYFFYSDDNPDGCVRCFCSGVTEQCYSALWYKSQIRPTYSSAQYFVLTNARSNRTYQNNVQVTSQSRVPVVMANLANIRRDVYYWQLPREFTGNQITSYGGKLQYIINYETLRGGRPITRIADVKLIGQNIELEHRSNRHPYASVNTAYEVILQENNFVHFDGRQSTREELMTVLQDVKSVIIRASYNSAMGRTMISGITMETALPQNNGNELAMAVERCVCPEGYTGLSCEKCDTGYFKSLDGACARCNCNGHSDICDSATGACLACRDNTLGANCEQCRPGFYGDATFGTSVDCIPCPCPVLPANRNHTQVASCRRASNGQPVCDRCPEGYEGDRCERCAVGFLSSSVQNECRKDDACQCDETGSLDGTCDANGQCNCKPSTAGDKCDGCKPSYFYFSVENVNGGCLPCFCMGVTRKCQSSTYTRATVDVDLSQNFGGIAIVDNTRNLRTVEELSAPSGQELVRENMQNLAAGSYYWQLPDDFRGDKVVSYGGDLTFTVLHMSYTDDHTSDSDVILIGNDIKLFAMIPGNVPQRERVERKITFREQNWQRADGGPATREHLLMALADVQEILIRATYSSAPSESRISSISMETASNEHLDGEPAMEVEECICPDGYEGLSCEDCAPGFTRSGTGLYLGLCAPCQCNEHADVCDSETGICVGCRDNTAGDFCDECMSGFYPYMRNGVIEYCRPCACPGTGENSFSDTCEFNDDNGALVCTACEEGYQGDRCEYCAPGYEGNPRIAGGRCTRQSRPALRPPSVTVSPRRLEIESDGFGRLRCEVESSVVYDVEWHKNGRRLSASRSVSVTAQGLDFNNFQSSDAGTYDCIATNADGSDRGSSTVTLKKNTPMIKVRVEEPTVQRVKVGSDVTFVCTAQSKMSAYILSWSKRNARLPRDRSTDFNGILHISNVQESDAGTLVCTGSNMYEIDQETATLIVYEDENNKGSKPTVTVTPSRQSVKEGDTVVFKCTASGQPSPTVEWRPSPGEQMPASAVVIDGDLHIAAADVSDTAVYYCRATNENGAVEATALLDVTISGSPPVVTVLTPTTEYLFVGDTVQMMCSATGKPQPAFTWRRISRPLPYQSQAYGGRMLLMKVTRDMQGTYACKATNIHGTDEGFIRVIVTARPETTTLPTRRTTTTTISTLEPSGNKPVCRTDPAEITLYVGARASVPCHVGGDPLPTVTWERDEGEPLENNAKVLGNLLRIDNITQQNAGEYYCVATNSFGTTRSVLTVIVENKELPRVEILPNNRLEVESGDSASFTCNPTNEGNVEVTWIRTDRKPFTSATEIIDGTTIKFTYVSSQESGSYLCIAKNEVGFRETAAQLIVKMKPTITITPASPIRVFQGDSMTLTCTADGMPQPNVAWKTVNTFGVVQVLTNYQKITNEYRIRNVQLGRYEYECVAYGSETVTQTAVVNVVDKPTYGKPVVTVPSEVLVKIGDDVEIECQVTGKPEPQVKWSRLINDQTETIPEGASERNNILRIPEISQAESGTYRCMAGNILGVTSEYTQITVIEPPTVSIRPGQVRMSRLDSTTISCNAVSGTQPIKITWTKQNGEMSESATHDLGRLQFSGYMPETDEGVYICTGTNAAGSHSQSVQVATFGPPTVTLSESSITVDAGETITLSCDSGASDVEWIRSRGEEMDEDRTSTSGGVLIIRDTRLSDAGGYICSAMNDAGKTTATATVTVQEAPKVEIITEPSSEDAVIITAGNTITIKCLATGNPAPIIALMKNDFEVLDFGDAELVIDSIQVDDSGRYSCMATNIVGVDKAAKTILVQANPPELTAVPESGMLQIQSGQQLSLECQTNGPHVIEWLRKDSELSVDARFSRGQFTIDRADLTDAGEYVCTTTANGLTVQKSINVTVNAFIPFFTQTPKSFLTVELLQDELSAGFRITLSFRPIASNGQLLFANGAGGDYISLKLVEGKLEFQYDVGSGHATIKSLTELPLSEWHTVAISRRGRDGELTVNDQNAITGQSPGPYNSLDLDGVVYIGGFPEIDFPNTVAKDSGFYGCISQVIINENNLDLGSFKRIAESTGVVMCQTCMSENRQSPCKNSAQCVESHDAVTGYTCLCEEGYVGPQCQFRKEDICGDPESCGFHGSCQPDYDRELGYRCECYDGYVGPKCKDVEVEINTEAPTNAEIIEPLFDVTQPITQLPISYEDLNYEPAFSQESYLELAPEAIESLGTRNLDLELQIKPNNVEDSVILYGESSVSRRRRRDANKNFVLLAIQDGTILLSYSCGSEPINVKAYSDAISLNEWHNIRIQRFKRKTILEVNGVPYTHDHSTRAQCRSGRAGALYIGGVKYLDLIPTGILLKDGFTGCARKLKLNGEYVNLKQALKTKNVAVCSDVMVTTTTTTTTTVPTTTTTTTTIDPFGPLFLQAPVTGPIAKFGGKSYAIYPQTVFPHNNYAEQFSLRFKTTATDGLIMVHGYGSKNLFMAGIKGSKFTYNFELDKAKGQLVSSFPVSDGLWHKAVVLRKGTIALMFMDDSTTPVAAQAIGLIGQAGLKIGDIYIGGSPNVKQFSKKMYHNGFNGCVDNLKFSSLNKDLANQIGSFYYDDAGTSAILFGNDEGSVKSKGLEICPQTSGNSINK